MFRIGTLVASKGRDEPLKHTWFRQNNSSHLAIVIPDIGLSSRTVVLSFVVWALLREGADVVWVELPYERKLQFQKLPETEQNGWILADVVAAVEAARSQGTYTHLSLVAKSRGTVALALLLRSVKFDSSYETIWISPYLNVKDVSDTIGNFGQRCLVIAGSSDPHFDQTAIDRIRSERGVKLELITGADEDLAMSGDADGSLAGVAGLEEELRAFVKRT